MLDRNMFSQVEQMKEQVQTMVALDILRLPMNDDVQSLRALAIETLRVILKGK